MISPLYDVAIKVVLVVLLGAASLYALNASLKLGATWKQCEEDLQEYREKQANQKPIVGFINGKPCYSREEMAMQFEQMREETAEQWREMGRSLIDSAHFDH
jgi:hypothetical protein